jgi:hypothetical protein
MDVYGCSNTAYSIILNIYLYTGLLSYQLIVAELSRPEQIFADPLHKPKLVW